MQVSVTSNQGLERKLTVEVPADKIEQEVQQRLKGMAGRVRIDGFRPGKVPFSVIRKRFGAQVREEVKSELVRSSFYEAIQQENLRPAGTPQIETDASAENKLAFTATFEVYPEVKVDVPADLVVEKPVVEVTDADVDRMLEKLRKQRAGWEDVDRAAAEGDQLVIDFVGKIDGEAFEGGTAEDYTLELGSKRFIEGFEDQLIGAKAGDSKEVSVSFPENYQSEALAGKPAVFDVSVKAVKGPKLPELDDPEFLQALGTNEGGVETLRQEVRQSMERELKQKIEAKVKEQLLDKMLDANPIDLPAALVEDEIRQMANQARQSMGMQGDQEVSDEIREALGDRARRRVGLGLLVGELIREKGFKADAENVRTRIEEMAQSYEDPQAVLNWYYQDKSRLSGVEALVLEDQVVDWLLSEVKTEDVTKSFDDIMEAQ
ncbi:trigger factor [Candidatus Tenderia electrophaga]|uniref:Trigger factor n=1 Tax=Candidatus Tenderia electrophaga TaxID=1748243 RepID=A0A0S2TEG5_9GAMM|nr:trigger factor [Candidatus Tenderia electrophaga]